jgi:pimeloyl-ACP methyl ester carboxylesterase
LNSIDQRIHTGSLTLQIREYPYPGEAVIFLHFSGGNLMMWQRAVPYFQDRYRLLLVDQRDHGRSDKPQNDGRIDTMAADISELMDKLMLKRAHLIGSSLGAEVGLSLAANYPRKVISLVCEGVPYSEFGPNSTWEGSEEEYKDHVEKILAGVRSKPDPIFPSPQAYVESKKSDFENKGWWNPSTEAFFEYDAFEFSPGCFTRSYQQKARLNYIERYLACRFEDYYPRVTCPLLLLSDLEDWRNERLQAAMLSLSRLARQSQIIPLAGWVHPYGWFLQPEQACEPILNFLAGNQSKRL